MDLPAYFSLVPACRSTAFFTAQTHFQAIHIIANGLVLTPKLATNTESLSAVLICWKSGICISKVPLSYWTNGVQFALQIDEISIQDS